MSGFPTYKIIDDHVHILPWEMLRNDAAEMIRQRARNLELVSAVSKDPLKAIEMLDEANVERACIISYVSPDVMGLPDSVNEFVADYCAKFPERLVSFGSPDVSAPSGDVRRRMRELLGDLGMKGIKIHPCHQLIYPNDYKRLKALEVIYSEAQERGVPVMFHTGTSIFPRAINRFGEPIYIDDVAVDFPDLKILVAHGGRPLWMEEAFFLVRRHKNVYLDISGIPPKRLLEYFPRLELIADKTLFGSDWPGPDVPSIRGNVEAIFALPFSQEAKRKIFRENASKVIFGS